MVSHKTVLGFLMVAAGMIVLGAEYIGTHVPIPFVDLWLNALAIVLAGTLPALMIVFGSIIIWGELEEKRAENKIIKLEKRLLKKRRRR